MHIVLRLIALSLMLICSDANALYTFKGYVLDYETKNAPSEQIDVKIYSANDNDNKINLLGTTTTDKEGRFLFKVQGNDPCLYVTLQSDKYLLNAKYFRNDLSEYELFGIFKVTSKIHDISSDNFSSFFKDISFQEMNKVSGRIITEPELIPSGTGRVPEKAIIFSKGSLTKDFFSTLTASKEKDNFSFIVNGENYKEYNISAADDILEANSTQPVVLKIDLCFERPLPVRSTSGQASINEYYYNGSDCKGCFEPENQKAFKVPDYNVSSGTGCGPWTHSVENSTKWTIDSGISGSILTAVEGHLNIVFETENKVTDTISAGACEFAFVATTTYYRMKCYQMRDKCREITYNFVTTEIIKTNKKVQGNYGCGNVNPCVTSVTKPDGSVKISNCAEPKKCTKKNSKGEEEEIPCNTCPSFVDGRNVPADAPLAEPGEDPRVKFKPACP